MNYDDCDNRYFFDGYITCIYIYNPRFAQNKRAFGHCSCWYCLGTIRNFDLGCGFRLLQSIEFSISAMSYYVYIDGWCQETITKSKYHMQISFQPLGYFRLNGFPVLQAVLSQK